MPLRLPPPPGDLGPIVESAILRADARAKANGPLGGGDRKREGHVGDLPQPSAPHEVYTLRVQDVMKGRRSDAARPVGWRTLILDGAAATAAVEVAYPPDRGGPAAAPLQFKSIRFGPYVQATVDGMLAAEQSPAVSAADYEVRFLEVPEIRVMALWLHRKGDEQFVPLKPAPELLSTNQLCDERTFFDVLTALTKQRGAYDDRPKGMPP